jgi:uroporphyrin-III C-methyltransferase/precorrin-2 dehydrogenase/sirohydrochlorin ferrochelatase
MDYLPLFHDLAGKPVLLVGGGTVAARKARLLARAGASLTIIAPTLVRELSDLVESDAGHRWLQQGYIDSRQIGDVVLAVAATDDESVNTRVSADARAARIPVNVVDSPALSSVIFPAIVDRSPLLVGISSGGRSPVLTRFVRSRLEAMLPRSYGALADFAGRMRERVGRYITDESQRRRFWERMVDGPVAEQVLAGREGDAEALLLEQLRAHDGRRLGEVYLIGAGPGDPDLMTFKALRLLQRADVVLYDRLVSPEILELARRDAERIYVGKARSVHSVPQPAINRLLVDLAGEGKCVARLKGGDPFVFGRGGEEIEELSRERIPFQVVPGITAANAAACYAGIPLTHRDHAQSVRFVAGYLQGDRIEHDWSQLLSPGETLVFYMGLVGLPVICEQLRLHGRDPETPVALVERATLREQRVLIGTLASMPDIVAREQPRAPTLIIVGDVVRLHRDLAWFGEQVTA